MIVTWKGIIMQERKQHDGRRLAGEVAGQRVAGHGVEEHVGDDDDAETTTLLIR